MKSGFQWGHLTLHLQNWLRLRARLLAGKYPIARLHGIAVVDLRTGARDGGDFERAMSEALLYLRGAEGGFAQLVTSHLRQVIAVDDGLGGVSPATGTYYIARFFGLRSGEVYLARKLVWAATFIGIMRHHPWWRRGLIRAQASASAREVRLRFARQFPAAVRADELGDADEP